MLKIQDFFIGEPEYIDIKPGEYEGPLVIKHSCTVDGHGATLWSKLKPVLLIEADNVTVKNLRVEFIGEFTSNSWGAVRTSSLYVQLENIEVYGGLSEAYLRTDMSLPESFHLEDLEVYKRFDYFTIGLHFPRTIDLGTFAAGEKNEFLIKLDEIHYNYRIISSIYGLKIEPQVLSKENTELKLTVEPIRDGNILYGELMLEMEKALGLSTKPSKILHRIYVLGRAQNGAAIKTLSKVQTAPPNPQLNTPQFPKQIQAEKKSIPVSNPVQSKKKNHFPDTSSIFQLIQSTYSIFQIIRSNTKGKFIPDSNKVEKGQKISAPNSENIRVAFRAANLSDNIAIDAYAFCLGENKKVQRDTDLIFFNNPRHESLGVSLDSKKNTTGIRLNLKVIPVEIQSVVIFFSIYDEGNRSENNFCNLSSPEVVVLANENIFCEFPLQLTEEKIFKALEIYREKGDWKMNFIGLSSEKDFAKICEFYGVTVL